MVRVNKLGLGSGLRLGFDLDLGKRLFEVKMSEYRLPIADTHVF